MGAKEHQTLPSPSPPPPPQRASVLLRATPPFRLSHRAVPCQRRKIAVVRLGGRRRGGRRLLVGLLRRLRLRWLASQYRRAVRRLRDQCAAILRDVIDGAAAMEAAHSRTMVDSTYFAAAAAAPFIPVAPSCHSYYYYIR